MGAQRTSVWPITRWVPMAAAGVRLVPTPAPPSHSRRCSVSPAAMATLPRLARAHRGCHEVMPLAEARTAPQRVASSGATPPDARTENPPPCSGNRLLTRVSQR